MSRGTAYYDLPNGERIELPTTMPDVEEVPGPLCDGKFELPEAVKEMFKWMDETFGTWESDFSSFKIWMKLRKNFNPPVRWEAVQDKRRNPKPLGRNTYLYQTLFELRNTVLNDQGGGFMEVTHGMTGTLRAQEHGHAPITFDKTEGNEKT